MPARMILRISMLIVMALGVSTQVAAQESKQNSLRIGRSTVEDEDSAPAQEVQPVRPARRDRNDLRLAQAPKQPNKNRPAPPAPADEGGQRDPTTVRPDLRPVLDPGATVAGVGANATTFRIRARVGHATGKAAAILEINGQLFMVQQGSVIETFSTLGELTVNVKKVSSEGVELEVEQTGKTIRLR